MVSRYWHEHVTSLLLTTSGCPPLRGVCPAKVQKSASPILIEIVGMPIAHGTFFKIDIPDGSISSAGPTRTVMSMDIAVEVLPVPLRQIIRIQILDVGCVERETQCGFITGHGVLGDEINVVTLKRGRCESV